MIYYSKVSPILLIAVNIPAFGMFYELCTNNSKTAPLNYWILLAVSLLCIFLSVSLFRIKYILTPETLQVKGIFYNKVIRLDSIYKIVYTYNPISSPAAGFKRLELFYGKCDSIIISPKRRQYFIQYIKDRNSSIEVKK